MASFKPTQPHGEREQTIATYVFETIEFLFVITQYTLLKQSAVQNKISRAKSSFRKFGKISTSVKKPAIQ